MKILKGNMTKIIIIALAAALFAPLGAEALTYAEVKPPVIKAFGQDVPAMYFTRHDGEMTRADALRTAFETMGWGFVVKALDQVGLLPEWPEVEGVSYLARTVQPLPPAQFREDMAAPVTSDDVTALSAWVKQCKQHIRWQASFPWEGTELTLVRRGVGNPSGRANGDLKHGVNEPVFAALLAVDLNKVPCQIATAVMVGANKAPLATIAAENYGVVGGINGGYFAGAKPIGVLRRQGYNDNIKFWPNRSAFGWNEGGEFLFIDGRESGNISCNRALDKYTEVLQAGPLLVKKGAAAVNTENIHPNVLSARHPRTFVGTDGKRVIWGVVDGRDKMHSVGMTVDELRKFCMRYGMKEALNLDGGGSSSLWWRGMTFTLPSNASDRERPVPYAILMFEPGGGVRK